MHSWDVSSLWQQAALKLFEGLQHSRGVIKIIETISKNYDPKDKAPTIITLMITLPLTITRIIVTRSPHN